jgi:hypothetical protein
MHHRSSSRILPGDSAESHRLAVRLGKRLVMEQGLVYEYVLSDDTGHRGISIWHGGTRMFFHRVAALSVGFSTIGGQPDSLPRRGGPLISLRGWAFFGFLGCDQACYGFLCRKRHERAGEAWGWWATTASHPPATTIPVIRVDVSLGMCFCLLN